MGLVVTVMVVSAATVVEALVRNTATHTITSNAVTTFSQAKKRRRAIRVGNYSSLMDTTTSVEDDAGLFSSLPAMSAEIEQQNRDGVSNKNNHGRRDRKRRRKQISSDKTSTFSEQNGNPSSRELLESIPKLSDIFEGRAASNDEFNEKKEKLS